MGFFYQQRCKRFHYTRQLSRLNLRAPFAGAFLIFDRVSESPARCQADTLMRRIGQWSEFIFFEMETFTTYD
jgi:hypothetical protein